MNANSSPTTTKAWLAHAKDELKSADIPTAELDSLVLLEDCLHIPRANILAHPETVLTDKQQELLDTQIRRRKTHEPLAYIRGKTEFYGQEFIVNQYTLVPRSETEILFDLLKKYVKPGAVLADIGTGSGAIAITAQLEFPASRVLATDISQECTKITAQNAQQHSVSIKCFIGDLLEPLIDQKIDVLLCNLPYVPDNFAINKAAQHEPKLALFAGKDGLDLYDNLFTQLSQRRQKPQYIFTESLPTQHQQLAHLARNCGYQQIEVCDFIQVFGR